MSARIQTVVVDNLGKSFDPESASHAFAYDGQGNLLTDACLLENVTRVKTFTYIEVNSVYVVATESRWIVQ